MQIQERVIYNTSKVIIAKGCDKVSMESRSNERGQNSVGFIKCWESGWEGQEGVKNNGESEVRIKKRL